MKVVITGADGFIGKNLRAVLGEQPDFEVSSVTRSTGDAELVSVLSDAVAVVHLAGVNRPQDPSEFEEGNVDFTEKLCAALRHKEGSARILFSSSTQVDRDNPYGKSKLAAEQRLLKLSAETGAPVCIYRLPNVFGKWCRPNYNSGVATFCYNVAHDLPLTIHNPYAPLQLVYIDDVVAEFARALKSPDPATGFGNVEPVYATTVGEVASCITSFKDVRENLLTQPVGSGLSRALYSTYVTYLDPERFGYPLTKYEDPRGMFVEMLKTHDSGQFSFFTAHPGITRGGHYHHSKTEKFLVVKGQARFRFRHILTNETFELVTDAANPTIVDTIPGWVHDITNTSEEEMIVMLWANEVFDRQRPDTIAQPV
jgi:UDP-2-acetamido-2,6-beta-L-arabino-hexul-4-ose reductase